MFTEIESTIIEESPFSNKGFLWYHQKIWNLGRIIIQSSATFTVREK